MGPVPIRIQRWCPDLGWPVLLHCKMLSVVAIVHPVSKLTPAERAVLYTHYVCSLCYISREDLCVEVFP